MDNLTKLLLAGAAVAGGVYAYKKFSGPEVLDPETFLDQDKVKQILSDQVQAAYHKGATDQQRLLALFKDGAEFAKANAKGICSVFDNAPGVLEFEPTPLEVWLEALGEEAVSVGYSREDIEAVVVQHIPALFEQYKDVACP